MKHLSHWAHDHKIAARVLICFIYLFLNILGLFTGDLLFSMNIELGGWFFYIAVAIALGALLYYPFDKKKKTYKNLYVRQKTADFFIGLATFLFIVFTGNYLNKNQISFNKQAYGISIIDVRNAAPGSNVIDGKKNTNTKAFSKKSIKKYLKSVVKNARKKYQESSKSNKTLYIILAVIGALALLYLLAGVSCSIMCSGSEALGYVVLFLGAGAIIFFFVRLVKRISRGKPKAAAQTE